MKGTFFKRKMQQVVHVGSIQPKMVLTRGEWVDGPGSLADSLAESAQVGNTDRLEEDPMGRTFVEGVPQPREDLVGGGWMECAVVIPGIYDVFKLGAANPVFTTLNVGCGISCQKDCIRFCIRICISLR